MKLSLYLFHNISSRKRLELEGGRQLSIDQDQGYDLG